jgi:hypothetical protein
VAWAIGTSTVLRGGWGRYYYHSGQFTTGLNVSSGMLADDGAIGDREIHADYADRILAFEGL